ncbi:uncharacterized protein LAESUDRAFT_728291 [Laetiporus sulphureus 93-53]|uniref:Uncharacterized protein n=1 Tax=Laetiporus sulphureus 93-53 TaxID=1314785 RepID=A0A165DA13_9APHY|nr:uncharacterized protein LAESUDRAFT_728291 [Laetiporus sulphureus 93-53]KZT04413.1 hypothetical protein LAESUDRAFT_728291 [Laetiporus sulphureus 93-53]
MPRFYSTGCPFPIPTRPFVAIVLEKECIHHVATARQSTHQLDRWGIDLHRVAIELVAISWHRSC